MFHLDPRSFAVALATAALATTLATLPAQSTGIRLNNAVDGFVEVPYSPEVVPQGGITVEAWVTYDDATIPASWSYPTVVRQNRNAGQESFFLRVNAKEGALLVQPTIGQRIALVRSAGDSVFVDADLSALGTLLPILGGGATGEARVPADWRANPDFWRHVI